MIGDSIFFSFCSEMSPLVSWGEITLIEQNAEIVREVVQELYHL